MATVSVLNTDAGLSGKTIANLEDTQIFTGVKTFAAHVLFTDALYDIGASGATRPRDFFLSRNATIGGTLAVTGALTGSSTVADSVGTMTTIRAGGIGIAAQVANDMIYASSATQLARVANGTTGQLWAATTGAAPGWSSAGAGAMTLFGQAEGTDATAAATNVATFAISGLTVKDSLWIVLRHSSVTQPTAEPILYSTTDSLKILDTNNGAAIVASQYGGVTAMLGADPHSAATQVTTTAMVISSVPNGIAAQTTANGGFVTAFLTPWTGAWTLALRTGAGGVTAGGTYRYRIAVYKLAGQ